MSKLERYASIIFLVFALLIRFPFDYFLFDIAQSFAVQIALLYLIAALLVAFWKKWWWVASSITSSLIVATLFIHWLWPNYPNVAKGTTTFKVAHFNVWKKTTQHQEVIRVAKNTQADVISFEEINGRWWEALLEGLQEPYPYWHVITREDNFGLAVFSKYPLKSTEVRHFSDVPSITTTLEMPFGEVYWISSHVLPPKSTEWYHKRNKDLNSIATYMATQKGYKLAVGDYNTVSWAPVIRKFKKTANLKDARRTFSPSWPTYNRFLGVPIDHIFHSPSLQCIGFKTTEKTASDHWGIVATFVPLN
ncbi:MAG TPA: hypothetical protein DCS93_30575 [Microscillaceae bacterium]|nr:hypothetical protein [Microscillaceae bacterium]